MNALTIYPYLLGPIWVFDDPRTGLKEEAFVLGMTEMIFRIVALKNIPQSTSGFALQFSAEPFDGFDAELTWLRSGDPEVLPGKDGSASQMFGNWYKTTLAGEDMEGWLCPALGLYFHASPARIYVKAAPLPAGIDPIWRIDKNAPAAVRFVSADASASPGTSSA